MGELTVDTTNWNIRLHDGANAGGFTTAMIKAGTANIETSGNLSAVGNVTGNFILGNGFYLTGIITSVANINDGTSNLRVTTSGGNIAANIGATSNVLVLASTGAYVTGVVSATGNLSTAGNVSGNYFLGNGALLTGVITSVANINNGTSNVTVVSSGGNVTIGVAGTSNVAVFSSTGLAVTGSITQNNVPTTTRATAMSLIYGG